MRLLTRKAILTLPIILYMAYEGFDRGGEYGAINERQIQLMQVVTLENPSGRTIFPTYQASGFIVSSSKRLTVDLYKSEFKILRHGAHIKVIAIPSKPNTFITLSRLEAAKPFIKLGALTVTWEFPVAIFFFLISIIYFVLPPTDAP